MIGVMSIDEVRLMIEVIYRESGKNTISVLNCLLEKNKVQKSYSLAIYNILCISFMLDHRGEYAFTRREEKYGEEMKVCYAILLIVIRI